MLKEKPIVLLTNVVSPAIQDQRSLFCEANQENKKHSSRMRTGRWLTGGMVLSGEGVVSGVLSGGGEGGRYVWEVVLSGEWCCLGGVDDHNRK